MYEYEGGKRWSIDNSAHQIFLCTPWLVYTHKQYSHQNASLRNVQSCLFPESTVELLPVVFGSKPAHVKIPVQFGIF